MAIEAEIKLETSAFESLTITLDRDELRKIIVKGMSYQQFDYTAVDVQRLHNDEFQIILTKPHAPPAEHTA